MQFAGAALQLTVVEPKTRRGDSLDAFIFSTNMNLRRRGHTKHEAEKHT